MIYLKAPGGIPIGFTLPLHETITEQWRNGVLSRVTEDGAPWGGDQFDLSGLGAAPEAEKAAITDGGQDPDADPFAADPSRPAGNAPLKAWQEYATALGACSGEEAAGMTRSDLIKLCTPPEADPLTAGE